MFKVAYFIKITNVRYWLAVVDAIDGIYVYKYLNQIRVRISGGDECCRRLGDTSEHLALGITVFPQQR